MSYQPPGPYPDFPAVSGDRRCRRAAEAAAAADRAARALLHPGRRCALRPRRRRVLRRPARSAAALETVRADGRPEHDQLSWSPPRSWPPGVIGADRDRPVGLDGLRDEGGEELGADVGHRVLRHRARRARLFGTLAAFAGASERLVGGTTFASSTRGSAGRLLADPPGLAAILLWNKVSSDYFQPPMMFYPPLQLQGRRRRGRALHVPRDAAAAGRPARPLGRAARQLAGLDGLAEHPGHDSARHSTTHSTTQHDTARHSATQHDTARHSTTQHDTARHSTTQHDTARHDEGRSPRGGAHVDRILVPSVPARAATTRQTNTAIGLQRRPCSSTSARKVPSGAKTAIGPGPRPRAGSGPPCAIAFACSSSAS